VSPFFSSKKAPLVIEFSASGGQNEDKINFSHGNFFIVFRLSFYSCFSICRSGNHSYKAASSSD
jgi:hypothetical protein